jgi:UDP-2,4-diacetamido-2,4,6-trideoxy-beta-L-altropyranose hydrolase
MTILIRADASTTIGSGHIMRTAELARRLYEDGERMVYLCRSGLGDLTGWLRQRGFEVCVLPNGLDEYSAIARSVEKWRPYLLIIDHYGITQEIEQRLKQCYDIAVLCFDDTFEKHHCDLLLNQNVYATKSDYQGKLPSSARICAGAQYSLMRTEFYRVKASSKPKTTGRKLLVSLGGSDPRNITAKLLRGLQSYQAPLEICVVVGAANPHRQEIIACGKNLASCRVLCDVADMARLMNEADFAITAAGQTTIEALFMELPMIAIELAENQQRIARYLRQQRLSIPLSADFSNEQLHHGLDKLIAGNSIDSSLRSTLAKAIGSRSPLAAIRCLRVMRFSLSPTLAADIEPLFELANEASVRAASISNAPIAWKEHTRWFAMISADAKQQIYTIRDAAGAFMGQLRFDCREAGVALISISIVKQARGCGVASSVIRRGAALLFSAAPERMIKAVVKQTNIASLKSFMRAGFIVAREDAETRILHLEKTRYDQS